MRVPTIAAVEGLLVLGSRPGQQQQRYLEKREPLAHLRNRPRPQENVAGTQEGLPLTTCRRKVWLLEYLVRVDDSY